MKKTNLVKVKVIAGKYKDRKGFADFSFVGETGNVMFYSNEGYYPYRVCLKKEEVCNL